MANRFGTANDYSNTFQFLYESNYRQLEAAAGRVDAQREAEAASRDSLIFTKWNEGQISGAELMAYIRRRQNETGYDKSQQNKWREAAITYGNTIADERAEANYAQSKNIGALISHYAQRLANAKKGTPERRELAQRIATLREQRDAESIRAQAKRISRAVERGDMGTKDLIKFYREQLQKLPTGSPLRDQIRDTLASLRGKLRMENFETAMLKIDQELGTGRISPQEAAKQKQGVLKSFEIERLDPVNYWKWQESVRQLNAMPDPTEVEKMQFELATGTLAPEDYLAKMNEFADRIAPFDLAASWELRTQARSDIESYKPLADPSAIGFGLERDPETGQPIEGGGSRGYSGTIEIVKRLRGNAIKHITQMDGSRYSMFNCTMAAGAMLAHAMGYTGLSGADLRNVSQVGSQATNIRQLNGALQKIGVEGTRINWDERIEFEKFKQRVANGAPAVLSGWLGDIPSQFNQSGMTTGHAMFVAGYDPQRDAFLMLDPAKSKDNGTWWPASIVEDFGWHGARHGQALFAPRGTVDPKTLKRAGGKVVHVSVNAPATRGGPGMSQFDPGPDAGAKLQKATENQQKRENARLQRRLARAGIEADEDLDTMQEVTAELERRWESYSGVMETVDQFLSQYAENGEEQQEVAIGNSVFEIGLDEIREMQTELLYLLDGQEALGKAAGDAKTVNDARKAKGELVSQGVALNTIDAAQGKARLEREVQDRLNDISKMTDPVEIQKELQEVGGLYERLAEVETPVAPSAEAGIEPSDRSDIERQEDEMATSVAPEFEAGASFYAQAYQIMSDASMSRDERIDALFQLAEASDVKFPNGWPDGSINPRSGDPMGRMIVESFQRFDEQFLLQTPDENGMPMGAALLIGGELVILPTKPSQRLSPEGALVPTREPDLSLLDGATVRGLNERGYFSGSDLPVTIVSGADGQMAHRQFVPDFVPYEGAQYLTWGDVPSGVLATLPDDLRKQVQAGMPLTNDILNHPYLNRAGAINDLIGAGVLGKQDFIVERVLVPDQKGGVQAWYKDTGTGQWHADNLPFVGRAGTGLPGELFGHSYTGVTLDAEGRPWPELVTDPSQVDPANLGVPAPYQRGLQPVQVGEYVRRMEQAGWNIDPLRKRDLENPENIIEFDRQSPEYVNQWGDAVKTIQQVVDLLKRGRDSAMEKIIGFLPDGSPQASDIPFLTTEEKRALALEHNIDYDSGQYVYPHARDIKTGARPGPDTLEELRQMGVTFDPSHGQQPAQTTAPVGYDPLGLVNAARGVFAANKADAAAKKAAAEARKAEEGRSTLPKVTPAPSIAPPKATTTPAPTPGPTPRPTPTPTPRPRPLVGGQTPGKAQGGNTGGGGATTVIR